MQLTMTKQGLNAVLDAKNKGLTLRLTTVKFGTAQYQVSDEMTDLKQIVAQAPIASGGVEQSTEILRLIANFKDTTSRDIYEVGIYDEHDILFALASSTEEAIFSSSTNFSVIVVLGLKLSNASNVELVLDRETSQAIAMVGLHISESNPHPQYALLKNMDKLLKRVEKQIGELLITQMPFENGEQVATYLGYGRWKRFGDGHHLATLRHSAPIQGLEFLSNIGKTGNALGRQGEKTTPSITIGAWVRIPLESDFISLTPNVNQIAVGQTVEFTLHTRLAQFTPVDYVLSGVTSNQIALANLSGRLVVGADGRAKLSITASDDYIAQGDSTMTMHLVDGRLSSSVRIVDSGETVAPSIIYKAGIHTFEIQPNQHIIIDMFAGGGGGGGSRYSTQSGLNVDGQHGGDITLTIAESSISVGGGRGGTGGVWGNGSSYSNGQAGAGGSNDINNQDNLEILINQRGNDARIGSRWETQYGAGVLAGAMSGANAGGNGGNGVGDERWSYGGGGGSGGHVKAKFINTTNAPMTATLVIGATGLGAKIGNHGSDGGFAYAVVV